MSRHRRSLTFIGSLGLTAFREAPGKQVTYITLQGMKALGDRVLLQVAIIKRKQEDGTEKDDIAREGVVMQNAGELKKGDVVYYNPFGCVEIESKRTKKALVLCVDMEDIYVLL